LPSFGEEEIKFRKPNTKQEITSALFGSVQNLLQISLKPSNGTRMTRVKRMNMDLLSAAGG